jgi:hypothetical protein
MLIDGHDNKMIYWDIYVFHTAVAKRLDWFF